MNDESQRLIEPIAGLTDEDLLRMVYFDYAQYWSEAITYAQAEIAKRGIPTHQIDLGQLPNTAIPHPFILWTQRLQQFIARLIRTRAFAIGFLSGGFVFVLLNIHSYYLMTDVANCCDGFVSFGFPFDWYTFGGYAGMIYIHWWKVMANVIAAVFMCLLGGWVFQRLIQAIRVT
jgi:hypothetical protein